MHRKDPSSLLELVCRCFSLAEHDTVGISGSNLVRGTDYPEAFPDFFQSLQANTMLMESPIVHRDTRVTAGRRKSTVRRKMVRRPFCNAF